MTTADYLSKIELLDQELRKVIVGQDELIESLIIALLSNWHIILEWVPWLAKTLSIQTLSRALDLDFKRVSFTPDLLPWDLIWWLIYNQTESRFYTKKWPIFTNFLLADEINRAPSKVQSALLEAMQERKVTIWDDTFQLSEPFFVLATQNPIEQEWTYNLPEAQLDRFLLKVVVDYPTEQEELLIMKGSNISWQKVNKVMWKKEILEIQKHISKSVFVDDKIYSYIKDIVFASRFPDRFWLSNISEYISYWASPRASIWLLSVSKTLAFLNWRDFVTPDDVKHMALRILRHRIWLSFSAIWENIDSDTLIADILKKVIVP